MPITPTAIGFMAAATLLVIFPEPNVLHIISHRND